MISGAAITSSKIELSKPVRLSVSSITLTNFRNYSSFSMQSDGCSVVITGNNGVGKTNLLEAISLLMPGRGLRAAKLVQLQKQPANEQGGWAVTAEITANDGTISFGTGQQADREDKRIIKIDGEAVKNQSALNQYFAVLWQTPQMDGLFTQTGSERRYYFDRICGIFSPDHSSHINKYDYLRRERGKLLALSNPDNIWLNSIEQKMAETSLAIAATRVEVVSELNHAIKELHSSFPKAEISLEGSAENSLLEGNMPAIEVEENLVAALAASRVNDAKTGRASHGAHKTELKVIFLPKGVEAAYCSTGEQKALLLSILLAQVIAIKLRQNRVPIILLDEVIAHLDEERRNALFASLKELDVQAWMTGTDKALFTGLAGAKSCCLGGA